MLTNFANNLWVPDDILARKCNVHLDISFDVYRTVWGEGQAEAEPERANEIRARK